MEENGFPTTGIPVIYPYRAVFDFEVFFENRTDPENHNVNFDDIESSTIYTAVHKILSVAIASNVPGYLELICSVNEGSEEDVVHRMLRYLNEIEKEAER